MSVALHELSPGGLTMSCRSFVLAISLLSVLAGCGGRDEASVVRAPAAAGATRGDALSDEEITRGVEQALRAEPRLSTLPVAIRARDGVVTLDGEVENVLLAQHAGVVAAAVPGVVSVDNRLSTPEQGR